MADSKKYNGSTWEHSLRKLTTATDTFTTLPVDIYADGNNATVGISGNTVQSGTLTPDNPIMPQGTGDKTGNLFDKTADYTVDATTYNYTISGLDPNKYYTCSTNFERISGVDTASIYFNGGNSVNNGVWRNTPRTFKPDSNGEIIVYIRYLANAGAPPIIDDVMAGTIWVMVNEGSTPIPYGYKIPISSASTTTPIYLGEVETMRKIRKYEFTGQENITEVGGGGVFRLTFDGYLREMDNIPYCTHYEGEAPAGAASLVSDLHIAFLISASGNNYLYIHDDTYINSVTDFKAYLAQQYANGTPVTVWYILATEETAVVNEPLCKIGDYADTVSGITVPTITGKDTFDVETTLKPSEVELTYMGWHDATVKEKSENLFNINAKDINNGYIDNANLKQDGTTETWSPCEVTEYIELVPNVSYRLSNIGSYNSLAYCIYDENKQYITGEQYSGQPVKAINMPPNGKYVRFSHFKTITETMLNEGSTALPYEPYWK